MHHQTGRIHKRIHQRRYRKIREKNEGTIPKLVETAELFLSLEYPDYERECEYVALVGDYIPLYEGEIGTTHGSFKPEEYKQYIKEITVQYSSAKHSFIDGRDYMVGALSRLNLNPNLREEAKEIADSFGYKFPCNRSAWVNAAQALENVHFAHEAMEIADSIKHYIPEKVEPSQKDGVAVGAIEAPRGLLIHHYSVKKEKAEYVNIITPTAMHAENIESTKKQDTRDSGQGR